jgi:hypothetical protein
MKTSNENKTEKKGNHNVETPTPPQVMDPSAPPVKKEEDKKKSKSKKKTLAAEEKKRPEEEKLAPNEEL